MNEEGKQIYSHTHIYIEGEAFAPYRFDGPVRSSRSISFIRFRLFPGETEMLVGLSYFQDVDSPSGIYFLLLRTPRSCSRGQRLERAREKENNGIKNIYKKKSSCVS